MAKQGNPIKQLRKFIGGHPALHQFGTQRGFADLIQRSEPYVRVLEAKEKIPGKVARQIRDRTGTSVEWLLDPSISPDTPLAELGGALTHQTVIDLVKHEIAENRSLAARLRAEAEPIQVPASSPYAKLVDGLLAAWRDKLIQELERGERSNFDDFMTRLRGEK